MASTRARTITKAVTWETLSNSVCFLIAYLIFGKVGDCLIFTVICTLLKLVLFYYHERLWHKSTWGKTDNWCAQIEAYAKQPDKELF